MYRWHDKYPLGSNPLSKLSSGVVLEKIQQFAKDFGLYNNASFGCEVVSTHFNEGEDRCESTFGQGPFNSSQKIALALKRIHTTSACSCPVTR